MISKLINKKNVASIVLLTLYAINVCSQEAEKKYHKEFSKLSLVIQPSYIVANNFSNNDGTTYPSIKFKNNFSSQFGVYYNFAQSGNFNFKTGFIAKEFSPTFDLNISNEDIGYGTEYHLTQYNPFNQFFITVPIKTEYLLKINSKFDLVIGAGLNFNYITGTTEQSYTTHVDVTNGNQSKRIFSAEVTQQEKTTFTSEASIGINYKTKYALLQLEYFTSGTYTSTNPIEGKYYIYNLTNSSNKTGNFIITGKFHGVSLIISPKKGWINKIKK